MDLALMNAQELTKVVNEAIQNEILIVCLINVVIF